MNWDRNSCINITYTVSLITIDDRDDQNYEEDKGATKLTGVHLRKLEQEYIKEQRKLNMNHLTKQPSCLFNNAHFCYDGELSINNDNEEKQFLKHK